MNFATKSRRWRTSSIMVVAGVVVLPFAWVLGTWVVYFGVASIILGIILRAFRQ